MIKGINAEEISAESDREFKIKQDIQGIQLQCSTAVTLGQADKTDRYDTQRESRGEITL
jgi:hypothetical protein